MAARSLFQSFARSAINRIQVRSISSSSSEAAVVIHEPIRQNVTRQFPEDDDDEIEPKDDLRTRIFSLRLPKRSATNVLERWIREGNEITVSDLRNISKDLRRSNRYKHALEISEWMISHEEYDVSDSDYAIRINLMTKVFGIDAAERYFEALPASAKTSETYTALLHSYAALKLTEKAEHLFERSKRENLSLTAITYNELMTLYMSVGQLEKVPSVVQEMKSKNVAPDLFTYNLRISSCAAALNVDEARKILDEMSVDSGCDEKWIRYQNLAKIYISATNLVNSDFNSVVESEKGVTQRELISYDFLVILYGGLGNKVQLDGIWKSLRMTRQKMTGRNYVCVLSSYLMLGHLKEAGEVIDEWKQSATSEFNGSLCNKLAEAFEEAGMTDTAASLNTLLVEKGWDVLDESK